MANEGENLAIYNRADLVPDVQSESCEFAKSNDANDAFVSVSQGEYEFRCGDSGVTEGLSCCEVEEIETWNVDGTTTRHIHGPESRFDDQLPRV